VSYLCYDLAISGPGGPVVSHGDPARSYLAGDTATICSWQYGNGDGGDISYVAPCDADDGDGESPAAATNTVTLWVDGLYLDSDGDHDPRDDVALGDWQNPCTNGCSLPFACRENSDSEVVFNLTLLREANQGFFDIAVNFDDVFCSAKLDCKGALLHDPISGQRGATAVLALACSAGPLAAGASDDTVLLRDPIVVDCGGNQTLLDPARGPGNVYGVANPDPDPGDAVWQYATYFGSESLECGAGSCNKRYWNVAIGFDPNIPNCRLTTAATAAGSSVPGFATPALTTYPWLDLDVALTGPTGGAACSQHPLNGTPAGLTTRYTSIDAPRSFCHRYDGDLQTAELAGCAATTQVRNRYLYEAVDPVAAPVIPASTVSVSSRFGARTTDVCRLPEYQNLDDGTYQTISTPQCALAALAAFHGTRLDWSYVNQSFSEAITTTPEAYGLSPTINPQIADAAGSPQFWNVGRVEDLNGCPAMAPWVPAANNYFGCANRPEFQDRVAAVVTQLVGWGADIVQFDDASMNYSAATWTPKVPFVLDAACGANNTQTGCFCDECMARFHAYLHDGTQSAYAEANPSNGFADTFLTGTGFTVFLVSAAASDSFGLAGNGLSGEAAVPGLALSRGAFGYNTDGLTWGTAGNGAAVTSYVHDGIGRLSAYRDGAPVATLADGAFVPVAAFGGGGNIVFPYQADNANQAGAIAELVIFDRALADSERSGIEDYLRQRYLGYAGSGLAPDGDSVRRYLKLWLRADSLAALGDGGAVTRWDSMRSGSQVVGPDAKVPAVQTPSGPTAAPPTLLASDPRFGGQPSVVFDGVDDLLALSWFNYRQHLRELIGAGTWSGNYASNTPAPQLRDEFRDFQDQSTRAFIDGVRTTISNATGAGEAPILSCNNYRGRWLGPLEACDMGMAEFPADTTTYAGYPDLPFTPAYYYKRIRDTRREGRTQVFTMPLFWPSEADACCTQDPRADTCDTGLCRPRTNDTFTWDDNFPAIARDIRKGIAMSYAAGGFTMAPWDTFTKAGYARYYGDPEQSADLYQFVRDNAGYFDGYADAQVGGGLLTDDRSDPAALSFDGPADSVVWLARAKPGDAQAPVVVHLVAWGSVQTVRVVLRLDRFFGAAPSAVRLLRPGPAALTLTPLPGAAPGTIMIDVPDVSPWAILVIEPPL